MHKSEKLEYGKAAGQVLDITQFASNLAFRAYAPGAKDDAVLDPSIATWMARIVKTNLRYSLDDNDFLKVPIKYCDKSDFEKFAPARVGQRTFIKHLQETPNGLMCLDLEKWDSTIEITGSNDSDDTQFLELTFMPCDINARGCRVGQFKDAVNQKIDTNKLWDELGMLELEVLSLQ